MWAYSFAGGSETGMTGLTGVSNEMSTYHTLHNCSKHLRQVACCMHRCSSSLTRVLQLVKDHQRECPVCENKPRHTDVDLYKPSIVIMKMVEADRARREKAQSQKSSTQGSMSGSHVPRVPPDQSTGAPQAFGPFWTKPKSKGSELLSAAREAHYDAVTQVREQIKLQHEACDTGHKPCGHHGTYPLAAQLPHMIMTSMA